MGGSGCLGEAVALEGQAQEDMDRQAVRGRLATSAGGPWRYCHPALVLSSAQNPSDFIGFLKVMIRIPMILYVFLTMLIRIFSVFDFFLYQSGALEQHKSIGILTIIVKNRVNS